MTKALTSLPGLYKISDQLIQISDLKSEIELLVGERIVLVCRRSGANSRHTNAGRSSTSTSVITRSIQALNVVGNYLDDLAVLSVAALESPLLKPAIDRAQPALGQIVGDEIGSLAPRLAA